MEQRYDVAVLGGGPAGYVAAIRAAQLHAKVVLFEEDVVGGTCLNRGCIPTKTYLKTAETLREIRAAAERGIVVNGDAKVDMPAAVACKNKVVKTLTGGVAALLKTNHVTVVAGQARAESARTVSCGGTLYEADRLILCGGSLPSLPPIPGIEGRDVLTSTEFLDRQSIPQSLCIIGGGVIGCELASVFRSFGAEVCIVEQAERLAPMFEKDISEEVAASLKKSGVKLLLATGVVRIETLEKGSCVVTEKERVACDCILAATGRKPNLSCLGELAGKLRIESGRVAVNDYLETGVPNVYACGDITGRMMLTHAAFAMGRIAAENCLGARVRCDLSRTPNCMYAQPEVASVGLTEEAARAAIGEKLCVGRFRIGANGRAVAYGEREGFVKVVADRSTGELLGVHIVGPVANELISEAAAAMEGEMTLSQITNRIVHPHPSFSEAFYEACLDALDIGIHQPPRKK